MSPETEAEFSEFVRHRGAALLRTACLVAGDQHAGQDLLQVALVKAVGHWPKIRGGGAEAYVSRVLVTTAIDRGRRRRWREVTTARPPEVSKHDARLVAVDERDALLAALRRLPAGQRAVLVLRYYADMSETQVAAELGVNVGTVKSQTSRALTALRTELPQSEETS